MLPWEGVWECPSEKSQHMPPPRHTPGILAKPLPQLRTGTLGPRAVVCSQDHQVAPSSLGFVPRGQDRVPPRLWSIVSYGGPFRALGGPLGRDQSRKQTQGS